MGTHPTPILAWDDLEVGTEAPAVSHKLGRTDLVQYAGASGDYNPMHTDEVAAQAAGLPSVFGHGMFSMGLLGRALTDWTASLDQHTLTPAQVDLAWQTITTAIGRPDPLI